MVSHIVCMYGEHFQQSMDQPGKVANPTSGQLNRDRTVKLVSRGRFGRSAPHRPAHSHFHSHFPHLTTIRLTEFSAY